MDKLHALSQFACFGELWDEAITVIAACPDSQESEYILTKTVFRQVLERAINGEIDFDDLVLWASVLESRQDIDESAVEGAVYALSNHEQMGELTKMTLVRLLALV